ncbi:hypothetical protein [Xanthomonas phage JGB6]|nr:hypothetical protein [Xanthomonas phage JGB6]
MGMLLERKVKVVIATEIAPGGQIYKMIKG